VTQEVPDNHPAEGGPRTALEWAQQALVALRAGKELPALPFKATMGKMANGDPVVRTGPESPKSKAGAPNASLTKTDDGTHGADLAMSDGSFFIQNEGDLRAAIDRVANADNGSLVPQGGFMAIKQHIVNRADAMGLTHLLPPSWQLSMAVMAAVPLVEEEEDSLSAEPYWARDFSEEERQQLVKEGKAIGPKGSYPIESLADLDNAIKAWGHNPTPKVKAHILKMANQLKAGPDVLARIKALGKSTPAKV